MEMLGFIKSISYTLQLGTTPDNFGVVYQVLFFSQCVFNLRGRMIPAVYVAEMGSLIELGPLVRVYEEFVKGYWGCPALYVRSGYHS